MIHWLIVRHVVTSFSGLYKLMTCQNSAMKNINCLIIKRTMIKRDRNHEFQCCLNLFVHSLCKWSNVVNGAVPLKTRGGSLWEGGGAVYGPTKDRRRRRQSHLRVAGKMMKMKHKWALSLILFNQTWIKKNTRLIGEDHFSD